MKKTHNVLIFPCGSEIGLEIHRSLKFSMHIKIYGASSVDDHGSFIYENYIDGVPFYYQPDFIQHLNQIIIKYDIDAVFPAMDGVIEHISKCKNVLSCRVIGSPYRTNATCLSKLKTYEALRDSIHVPKLYSSLDDVDLFPVFMKPDIGYGSRGAKLILDKAEGVIHLKQYPKAIILENLPGKEFTVDCFTDKNRKLLFSKARERIRIINGISVRTQPVVENQNIFTDIADKINKKMIFRGAWFFQVKENLNGKLVLMEVASRLGGSSSLFRNTGVNFSLMSVFDAFDYDVDVISNENHIILDRALSNKFKLDIQYERLYIDYDDCLVINEFINSQLITLLYQSINDGKKVILITKHDRNIDETLKKYRLSEVFDEIIHIKKHDDKSKYIELRGGAIFIDDSFSERKNVFIKLRIPVFAPDSVECLLK